MKAIIEAFRKQMEVVRSHFKPRKTLKLHPHQQLIMDDLKAYADNVKVMKFPSGAGKTRFTEPGPTGEYPPGTPFAGDVRIRMDGKQGITSNTETPVRVISAGQRKAILEIDPTATFSEDGGTVYSRIIYDVLADIFNNID